MNEDFLYYLWKYHLPGKTLTGSRKETIYIQHPGQQNYDSGPDFFNRSEEHTSELQSH